MVRTLCLALVASCVLFTASAARADEPLTPASGGVLVTREIRAATAGFGLGVYWKRVGGVVFGRAALAERATLGMGGAQGSYALVERKHVHFGPDLAVSFGAGRIEGRKTGLLAAFEPGLFLRFLTKKVGAIQLGANWYQPVRVRPPGPSGGALLTLSWSPFTDLD